MVAFVTSMLIGIVAVALPLLWALKKRPLGGVLTWGEAMIASAWAFFCMFWFYGVIPHQWLAWADNELNWRRDKVLHGPGNIVDRILPFDMNYLVVRDLIAVVLYLAFLGGNSALWGIWQARGKKKPSTDVQRSGYGRPLVKA